MRDRLITYDTALKARDKGFNWTCQFAYKKLFNEQPNHPIDYSGTRSWNDIKLPDYFISCPTQSQLQNWLRTIHNINVYCTPCDDLTGNVGKWYHNIASNKVFTGTYEEALENGLKKALELI